MIDSVSTPEPSDCSLSSLLDTALISLHADITSSKKLLQEMARLLTIPLNEDCKEKDVYHHLLEREKLGNTGIGNGVALPHSRYAETERAVVAIITLSEPIDYDSLDRQAVDVAFGLLVPENASQAHLNLLADIARIMSNEQYKASLLSTESADDIVSLIDKWTTN